VKGIGLPCLGKDTQLAFMGDLSKCNRGPNDSFFCSSSTLPSLITACFSYLSVKGSAFAQETDLFRWKVGSGKAIPALDEAVRSMKEGGIRQIIVPPNMGYPSDDPKHELVGPKPSTFSGERALDFVLENSGIIDKTLLINIKLKRVDKPGQRGYKG
jgi:hypothetical protein